MSLEIHLIGRPRGAVCALGLVHLTEDLNKRQYCGLHYGYENTEALFLHYKQLLSRSLIHLHALGPLTSHTAEMEG